MINRQRRILLKSISALAVLTGLIGTRAVRASSLNAGSLPRWRLIGIGGIGAHLMDKFLTLHPAMLAGRVLSISALRAPQSKLMGVPQDTSATGAALSINDDTSTLIVTGLGGTAGQFTLEYSQQGKRSGSRYFGVLVLPYDIDRHYEEALCQARQLAAILQKFFIVSYGMNGTLDTSYGEDRRQVESEVLDRMREILSSDIAMSRD